MSKYVYAFLLFVTSFAALAQERPEAPVEKADPIAIILFGVVVVGMIVWYGLMIWRKDRQSKDQTK